MSDEWTEKLSEYLDDELSASERAALELHRAECRECSRLLDELQRVVATAKTLTPRPPDRDLWNGIAGRTVAGEPFASRHTVAPFPHARSRRISFTLPQLAAASLLLAAVSGGLAWEFRGTEDRAQNTLGVPNDERPQLASDSIATVSLADEEYDAAVSDLEKAVKEGRGVLDSATIAIVEQNLEIINVAIDQARQALAADPANSYVSGHLVEARRKKLDLLRRAAAMVAESTQS